MKIVVLAGGYSPEREVSLSSGSLIANALIRNGHRVLLLDAYVGIPELPDPPDVLFRTDTEYSHAIGTEVPDLQTLKEKVGNGNALIGRHVLELCASADAVFLALHGAMGENGMMQAVLESYGIPHTGSDYTGCLLAMDKDLAKRLFCNAGIPTPEWVLGKGDETETDRILQKVGLPCVVKPLDGGSSVGISMANTRKELIDALRNVAEYGGRMLAERKIEGRELTMGILEGMPLPPVEIIPKEGFYDYRNKYQGSTREICPAEIPPEIVRQMEGFVRDGFSALRLGGYARFDFLLDREGHLWCLEANALPGMTPTSLLPQEARAIGISYAELCERILQAAIGSGKDNRFGKNYQIEGNSPDGIDKSFEK